MQSSHRCWCRGVVIGFVLVFCLYNFVLHTVPPRPDASPLDDIQRMEGSTVLSTTDRTAKSVMDTLHTNASDAPVLNCSRIPGNIDSWKVYEEIMHPNNERKEAVENTDPLHQCSVRQKRGKSSSLRFSVVITGR